MGTPADMRLKANMMPDTGKPSTGSSPAFGTPEWRAKYGKTVKGGKKKTAAAPAAAAAGASKSPAFGTPEWRAKYGK